MDEELIIKIEPVEVEEEDDPLGNKSVASRLQEVRECLSEQKGDRKRVTRSQKKIREREADHQRKKPPAKKSRLSGGRVKERSTGAEVDVDEVEKVEQKFIRIPEMRNGEPKIAVTTPSGKAKRTNKKKVTTDARREKDRIRKQQSRAAMSEEDRNKIRAKVREDKRRRRAELKIEEERIKLAKEELIKKCGENAPELENKSLASLLDEMRERNKLRMAERRSQMTEEEREAIRKRDRERQQQQRKALSKLAAERESNVEASTADLVEENPGKIEELKKMEARLQAREREKERNRLRMREIRGTMTEDERKVYLSLKREQTRERRKNPPVSAEHELPTGGEEGEVEDEEERRLSKLEEIRKKNREGTKRRREMQKVEQLKLGLPARAPRRTKEECQLERRYADALKLRRGQPERTPEEDSAFLELEKERFKALEERRRKLHNLPEMTEEERLKWIEKVKERAEREQVRNRQRRAQMTEEDKKQRRLNEYLRRCAERAERRGEEESPEEKERQLEFARKWRQSLTGEKRQRYLDSVSRAHKKWMDKVKQDPALWQQHKDKFNEKLRNKTKNETAEDRQRRLLRYQLYQKRKAFRKDLEESGCSEEEVRIRCEEFSEKFYLEHPITRPKPTTRSRKRRVKLPTPPLALSSLLSTWPSPLQPSSTPSVSSNKVSSGSGTRLLSSTCENEQDKKVSSMTFDNNPEVAKVHADSELFGLEPSFQDDFDDDCDYSNSFDAGDDGEDEFAADDDASSVAVPTLKKEPSLKPVEIKNEKRDAERAESQVEPEVSLPQTKSMKGRRKAEFTTLAMCEDCGKAFANHRICRRHKRLLHEDPRKCPHPQCDFTYRYSDHLWKHFRHVHVQKERPAEEIPEENPVSLPRESEKISLGRERLVERKQKEPIPETSCNMCPECGKIFKTKCTVDDHIRRVHQGQGFHCDLCRRGGDLQSAGKLWKHKVEKHGLTDLPPPPNLQVRECEYCGEKVLRSYKHHILKKHPEMKHKIPDFVLELEADAQIEVHTEQSRDPRCVKCPKCSTVIQKLSLKRHLRSVHGLGVQMRYPCPNCKFEFKHRNHLNEHLPRCLDKSEYGNSIEKRTRTPNKSAPCVLCGAKFVYRRELQEHLQERHPQEYESMEKGENPSNIPLECQHCFESFSDFHQLRDHLECTHPESSLKCPECEKVMLSSVELALHISMDHHGIVKTKKPRKKYPPRANAKKRKRKPRLPHCFRCDEKFPTPKELSEHVQSAHPASYFPCSHCSSLLYSERVLAFHILRRCKKIESKAQSKKEMTQNDQTPIHMVKIKCKLCSTGGLIVSTLTKHMRRVHQITETSFECEHCRKKTFKMREYWLAHLENEHGTLVEEVYERAASEVEEEDDVDKKKKTTKKVQIRKKSRTGSSRRGRGRPRKRRLDDNADEDEEEDQLETLEHFIPTETRRGRGRPRRSRRVISLNLKTTITQPCFVRLIRMSDEEINEIITPPKVKVERF